MSWLHSQQSDFVFTVAILLEGTVYVCDKNMYMLWVFIFTDVLVNNR